MRPINEIIIHCSATRREWMEGAATSAKVAEIRRWHLARGWSDIGYHYLIDRDGTVRAGRWVGRTGAHVAGHNTGTIGICLIGGHGSSENDRFADHFTPEQDRALRALLDELKHDHPKITKISGHNEYSAKACPGFTVKQWLAEKKPRKMAQSTTLQATGAAFGGWGATVLPIWNQLETWEKAVALGVATALAWIARERIKKWVRGIR